ncbi:hypothetical protein N7475_003776 [Penicillium sp. IBT 31633x]|nr:hypothetical protein N7475_003776 [Penicillium sp. IBT 31633x]
MLAPHLTCALLAQQTLIFLGQDIANQKPVVIYPRDGKDSRGGTYQILSTSHNGTSKVRLDIPKPAKMLDTETLLSLDAPQVYLSTAPYLTNETNPNDSLVVTFFASAFPAFPYLRANETFVVNVWLWASFANGTVVGDYAPATVATVTTVSDSDYRIGHSCD